jgi:hypothetical protein
MNTIPRRIRIRPGAIRAFADEALMPARNRLTLPSGADTMAGI